MANTAELLDAYADTAERWAISQDDLAKDDARAANALFRKNHALYKELRTTAEGREGIGRLMDHPATGVRLLAATASLAWDRRAAISVLRSIEKGPGLHAVSAKYTLKAFKAGTLDLDW